MSPLYPNPHSLQVTQENVRNLIPEFIKLNLLRGRGLFCVYYDYLLFLLHSPLRPEVDSPGPS